MKMKNSKVMLALFVVAALAMVSVAGVAISSEKADAKVPNIAVSLDINSDSVDWYNIYVADGASETHAYISKDAKYSGQIQFGTYDQYSRLFDAKVAFEFTDVSDLRITYSEAADTVEMTGDTTGTIKLLKGEASLGSADKYFNGKISGTSATVDAKNIYGFKMTAGAVDIIGGEIERGGKMIPKVPGPGTVVAPASVTVEGNAILYTGDVTENIVLKVGANVTFKIAEGATVTGGGNAIYYEIPANAEFTVTIGAAGGDYKIASVFLLDSGNELFAEGTFADNTATFGTHPAMSTSKSYKLLVLYQNGANDSNFYFYFGTLTFKWDDTHTTLTGILTESSSIGRCAASEFTGFNATTGKFNYDPAKYKPLAGYCKKNAASAAAKVVYSEVNGTISFTSVNSFANNDKIALIMVDKASGALSLYNGKVEYTISTNQTSPLRLSVYQSPELLKVTTVTAAEKITFVAPTFAAAQAPVDQRTGIELFAATSAMKVDGKLILKYTAASSNAYILKKANDCGKIGVKGTIEYGVATAVENAPIDGTNGPVVNAACYKVATEIKKTYYYTTLDNAMLESDDIFIFGIVKVLKDTTLAGKSATSNKVTIGANSTLEIGQNASDVDDTILNITAVVTVPKTTILDTDYYGGIADVINGQLKIEDELTDRGANVRADVFYIAATYGIYTDLATALDNAKSGDTVTVRDGVVNITLARNTEVKEGVTLDAERMTGILKVASGTVFTMSGKMTVNKVIVDPLVKGEKPKDAGRLLLKSVEMKVNDSMTIAGVLEFADSFDNTTAANKSKFSVNELRFAVADDVEFRSIMKIDGKLAFDLANVYNGGDVSIVVPGTARFTVNESLTTIYIALEVTGTVTFVATTTQTQKDIGVAEITATGKAKIVPATDGKIYVAESAVFGTAANTLTQSINEVDATVYLDSAYATVFGEAAKVSVKCEPMSDLEKSEFFIVVKQQSNILYQTVYADETYNMSPLPVVKVTGYKQMSSWYENIECTQFVSTATCGAPATLYTGAEKLKYTITLEAQNGIKWRVDNVYKEGIVVLEYGEHKVNIDNVKGYDISKVTLSKDGSAYTANSKFMLSDDTVFSATAPAVVEDKSEFGLIEILLIIITIVIVIMVIIIAMKFMRS